MSGLDLRPPCPFITPAKVYARGSCEQMGTGFESDSKSGGLDTGCSLASLHQAGSRLIHAEQALPESHGEKGFSRLWLLLTLLNEPSAGQILGEPVTYYDRLA